MVTVFANDSVDRGSTPRGVIQKTQKMILNAFLANTQHYEVGVKGKRSNPGKEEAPSPRSQYSSNW